MTMALIDDRGEHGLHAHGMEQAGVFHHALLGRVVQHADHHKHDNDEPEQEQPPVLHSKEKQHHAG